MRVRGVIRIVLQVLGAALCVLAGAAVVAWLAGRVLSDRYAFSQWLLWIPTPAMLPVALLGLLGAIAPGRKPRWTRRRVRGWIVAALVIGAYFAMIEHRLWRRTPPTGAGLGVAYWNMTSIAQDTMEAGRLQGLLADVTILGEGRRVTQQNDFRSMMERSHETRHVNRAVVLTRLPILELRPLVSRENMRVSLIRIDARELIGRELVIFAVDLPSSPKRPRYRLASTLRRLLEEVNAPQPDLVVGDFNMTRDSAALRRILPGYRHAFRDGGHGYAASFPRRFPLYHIDHMLVGPGLRATRYDLVDVGLGRHLLQRATFTSTARPPVTTSLPSPDSGE